MRRSSRRPSRRRSSTSVLDLDAMKKGITVPEEDLRKYYEENKARFTAPEERRASHILVKADKTRRRPSAPRPRQRPKRCSRRSKKTRDSFAELAKKNSDDPGLGRARAATSTSSAAARWSSRSRTRCFALKPGETSGIVETDFGYHIIKLTAVRGGDVKPLRRGARRDRGRGEEAAGAEALRRGGRAVQQHRLRAVRQPEAGGRQARPRVAHGQACSASRPPVRSGPLASAKLLDARVRQRRAARTSATPRRSRPARTS